MGKKIKLQCGACKHVIRIKRKKYERLRAHGPVRHDRCTALGSRYLKELS